jgi:hypothetical protein
VNKQEEVGFAAWVRKLPPASVPLLPFAQFKRRERIKAILDFGFTILD